MILRKLSRIASCFIGLVIVPAGMLFAQQTELERTAADRTAAEQSIPKSQYSNEYRVLRDHSVGQALTLVGLRDWNLAAATYGNQVGVEIAELDAALRTQLGIEQGVGVLVTGVSPESEAAKALLVQHDLILKIDDQAISGTKQFNDLIGTLQGKTAQFYILRKGKPSSVSVALPKAPVYSLASDVATTLLLDAASVKKERLRQYRIGVTLAEADDALRSQLRLASGEGLVVTDVVADSPAAKAGIQRHDVLTKLDGKRLTAIEAVNAQIQEIKDRAVPIALYRAGSELVVTVTPRLTDENPYKVSVLTSLDGLIRIREAWDPVQFRDLNVQVITPEPSPRPTAAAQIAELKKQLAELQKTMESLEAALQSESADKPQPPDEPK